MMNLKSRHLFPTLILTAILVTPLTGCSGGGGGSVAGSSSAVNNSSAASGSLSGTAVKGPVNNGTVRAYAIANGAMGSLLGQSSTDTQGNFRIDIGDYSGQAMVQITGGSYTDEATGTTMPLATGDMMSAVIPAIDSGSAISDIQVTPLTSIAEAMAGNMTGGMTPANIAAANTAVGAYFMVGDIVHTPPINPLQAGSGAGATQAMINYGMTLAAISQEAKTLRMTTSSANLVSAMMNDASDGTLNGMMGSTSITMGGAMMGGGATMSPAVGTSDLAAAMSDFMGSVENRSGLTAADMQTLINSLAASNGTLQ